MGASVWGTARGHCGQYNFWLNIRYGETPKKTEDAAGHVIVCVRERGPGEGGFLGH